MKPERAMIVRRRSLLRAIAINGGAYRLSEPRSKPRRGTQDASGTVRQAAAHGAGDTLG